jgi:hypothetical protein
MTPITSVAAMMLYEKGRVEPRPSCGVRSPRSPAPASTAPAGSGTGHRPVTEPMLMHRSPACQDSPGWRTATSPTSCTARRASGGPKD